MDTFGRIISAQQQVYLNTGRLWGINSLDISPNLGAQPLIYLGIGNKNVNQILNSEQSTDVSIGYNLIDSDPFIQYTGSDCFNIFVLQNQMDINNNYSLISGYLNSYTAKFSIGQPIQINTNIKFFHNGGRIPTGSMDVDAFSKLSQIPNNIYEDTERKFHIPNFNSTELFLNEYNTQRITDATIDLKISRIPIYNIGNKKPSKINIVYPIQVTCSFTIEINPLYSGIELQSFPSSQQIQNISFNLYEYNNPVNLITSYNFSGMTAINERYGISAESNVTVTKEYMGYIYN